MPRIETLDVNTLPRTQEYKTPSGLVIDLNEHFSRFRLPLTQMAETGVIDPHGSIGFALALPQWDNEPYTLGRDWDDPQKFVWVVEGWGPEADRYIANAVRKLRPLLREDRGSTLELRLAREDVFRDIVKSTEPDGTFAWGDYDGGGATMVRMGELVLVGAASGLSEAQDDLVITSIMSSLAERIHVAAGLLG